MTRGRRRLLGLWVTLGSLAVAVAISGCTHVLVVDASSNGGLIRMQEGDLLTVRLRGNPSTGTSWRFSEQPSATVLEMTRDVSFSEDADNVCGSPGTFTFRFRASGPGTTRLVLHYGRPWEDDVLDTFTLIVYVI